MTRHLLFCLAFAWTAAVAQEPAPLVATFQRPVADSTLCDVDGDGKRDLLLIAQDGGASIAVREGAGFAPALALTLKGRPAAIAVADMLAGGGHEVVALSAEGVEIISFPKRAPVSARFVALPLIFPPGFSGQPSFWGWGEDLDGDGRDDLLLPGLQNDCVLFGYGDKDDAPRRTPILVAEETRREQHASGSVGIRRRRPRLAMADLDGKGRRVPVFLDDSGLHRVGGDSRGFGPEFSTVFPLKRSASRPLDVLQRLDIRLEDLNGDRRDDMILARTRVDATSRILEQRTQLLIFTNKGRPEPRPAQVIVLPGVISNGPYLRDVDGDGIKDLFLSVYGGKITSNLSRLVLGSVKLTYHLYRGSSGERPFSRAPEFTLTDKVPLDDFDDWDLRHRVFLDADWTGDGKLDLVRVSRPDENEHVVDVLPAKAGEPWITFASDPRLRRTYAGPADGYASRVIENGVPAVQISTKDRVAFIPRR